jgi:hypothetical protein
MGKAYRNSREIAQWADEIRIYQHIPEQLHPKIHSKYTAKKTLECPAGELADPDQPHGCDDREGQVGHEFFFE